MNQDLEKMMTQLVVDRVEEIVAQEGGASAAALEGRREIIARLEQQNSGLRFELKRAKLALESKTWRVETLEELIGDIRARLDGV